jgi:hypothetical protein
MTFQQWAAVNHLEISERGAFEAVWNELSGGGCSPGRCRDLLDDVLALMERASEDEDDDAF